jgi:excisionase family DNA binding protein
MNFDELSKELPMFLTTQQVADLLHVSTRTIEKKLADGTLPKVVAEGIDRVLIPRQAVIDLLRVVPPKTAVEDTDA